MPYFPPSQPDFNFLRHLLLLYGDANRPWTHDSLRHAVAHLGPDGTADDWLFDSFLFLNVKSASGRDYCADVNLGTTMCGEGDFFAMCSPQPATREDWEELLEFYLGSSGSLRTLDAAIGRARDAIGRPYGPKRNAVLMLPYPHVTQGAWGRLQPGGPVLDFTIERQNLARATGQRLEACSWMLDEIARRVEAHTFEHVHLLGVYWMFESVHRGWDVDDHWLLKSLRPCVHRHGWKFLWIPFWSAYNVHLLDDYRSYYFDLAFLQPNYMFYKEGKSLEAAAEAARSRNAGLEMEYYLELHEPIGVTGERHSRFRDYLNGGVTLGYMRESACAHFQGVGALEAMRVHEDPREREFYDDIYHFVKGDYALKPAIARSAGAAPRPRAAIAVDLGGTNLRAAVIDERGQILAREAVPTPGAGAPAILEAMVALAQRARADANAIGVDVAGIGVSTGGRVDAERGVVLESSDLITGWADVPLAQRLGERTGEPVRIDNDGHCAAIAERHFGHGRGVRSFVTVVVGTGIGGGVVLDGQLWRGARNTAGELGHVMVAVDGPRCACGSRGCVETYASGSGLAARALERIGEGTLDAASFAGPVSAQELGRLASEGHDAARELIAAGGRALGVALASLLNVLNPERIILGGPVLRLGDAFVGPLREAVAQRTLSTPRDAADIVISELQDAPLLGAAALVLFP